MSLHVYLNVQQPCERVCVLSCIILRFGFFYIVTRRLICFGTVTQLAKSVIMQFRFVLCGHMTSLLSCSVTKATRFSLLVKPKSPSDSISSALQVLILSPACVHAFPCHPLILSHLSLSLSPCLCLSENEEWWNLSVPVATGGTWIEASASRCLIYDNVYR